MSFATDWNSSRFNGNGEDHVGKTILIPEVVQLADLVSSYPHMREPIIDGLLRAGETCNIIAPPKYGKSWLAYSLCLSVVSRRDWLNTFPCKAGRVLLLDNELHSETIAQRLPRVAEAMELEDDYINRIDVVPLRGTGIDMATLSRVIDRIEHGTYRLVVADAWYRFIPAGTSENDNAAVMGLYNRLDGYADQLGAAWVNIHHTTKGDQSAKAVTDVGAGAGSQARAADTHIVLRPHELDNVTVMEAVVRSFPAVDPIAIRWEYPLWHLAADADPAKLKRTKSEAAQRKEAEDAADMRKIYSIIFQHQKASERLLRKETGFGQPKVARLIEKMKARDEITAEEETVNGNSCLVWRISE